MKDKATPAELYIRRRLKELSTDRYWFDYALESHDYGNVIRHYIYFWFTNPDGIQWGNVIWMDKPEMENDEELVKTLVQVFRGWVDRLHAGFIPAEEVWYKPPVEEVKGI